jgi:hypothetical protein
MGPSQIMKPGNFATSLDEQLNGLPVTRRSIASSKIGN